MTQSLIAYMQKHFSNEKETLKLKVIKSTAVEIILHANEHKRI